MVFSSLLFTFFFLPAVLFLYYLSKIEYRNYILLAVSLLFYAYGEPRFVFIMLISIAGNYMMALVVDKFRGSFLANFSLTIDIVMNLGILFAYKYVNFAIHIMNRVFRTDIGQLKIVLPIGISFFTFQALSYVIDVFKGRVKVQKDLVAVALYISFFPQLVAGPIVRYSDMERQIIQRRCSVGLFATGIKRFMIGFAKKVILANNLALIADGSFSVNVKSANILYLWLGAIAFSLQIYYDFSGYSDMAIGLGKMFGFNFNENFEYPYISRTATEFWRRWHISLGSWFRDYVYIPLGGSRVSLPRQILNLFVVWTLTGLWHGANYTFIMWGLGWFILLVFEKMVVKPSKRKSKLFGIFWQILTMISVIFLWIMFNSSDWKSGIRYILGMIGYYGNGVRIDTDIIYNLREYGVFLVWGILCSTPALKIIGKRCCVWIEQSSRNNVFFFSLIEPIVCTVIFLWAVSFLIIGAHNPFIYFNF